MFFFHEGLHARCLFVWDGHSRPRHILHSVTVATTVSTACEYPLYTLYQRGECFERDYCIQVCVCVREHEDIDCRYPREAQLSSIMKITNVDSFYEGSYIANATAVSKNIM